MILKHYFVRLNVDSIKSEIEKLKNNIEPSGRYYKFKQGFDPTEFTKWYEGNLEALEASISGFDQEQTLIDADTPSFFEKSKFITDYLYPAMNIEGRENSRIREYCSTLILRMTSFFTDERYKILFDDYQNFPYALSTFLRYCFGRMKNAKIVDEDDEFPKVTVSIPLDNNSSAFKLDKVVNDSF